MYKAADVRNDVSKITNGRYRDLFLNSEGAKLPLEKI